MIEYKLLDTDCEDGWIESAYSMTLKYLNFKHVHLRIDGVVYTEYSEELVEAHRKAKFWMQIQK